MANLFLLSRKAFVMCYCFHAPIKAASGVYSATIMMQMRQEVIGSRRESSAGLGKGRRSIKKGHLSCYYMIVKSELIYVYEG